MNRFRHVTRVRRNLFAMVAVSIGFIACTKEPIAPFDFDREVRSMQALTAVDGAQVLRASDIEPGKVSLRVSWDLEAPDLEWVAYSDELRKRLAGRPEFRVTASSDGALGFVRSFPTDVHVLRIERVSSGPPMRALVTFISMAD